MTQTEAMHCCPQIESIQPINTSSTSLQKRIFELLYEYTDLIEKISDTAFYMDITFNKLDIPIGFRTAQLVHSQLRNELELDAVVGIPGIHFPVAVVIPGRGTVLDRGRINGG